MDGLLTACSGLRGLLDRSPGTQPAPWAGLALPISRAAGPLSCRSSLAPDATPSALDQQGSNASYDEDPDSHRRWGEAGRT